MTLAWRNFIALLGLGAALICAAGVTGAKAQYYYPYAYGYPYAPQPYAYDDDDDAPRFGSRRAIARILAREGFDLVGPLGRRGDQIVATGVNRRDGRGAFRHRPFRGTDPPGHADRPASAARREAPARRYGRFAAAGRRASGPAGNHTRRHAGDTRRACADPGPACSDPGRARGDAIRAKKASTRDDGKACSAGAAHRMGATRRNPQSADTAFKACRRRKAG